MDKLSAIDASFLYAETARMPMHVTAVQIYDSATAPNGQVDVAEIIENVRCRAHHIHCFHSKLLQTPWLLDHPCWIEDPDFDPSRHVYSVTLPAGGGWRALCETVSQIAGEPLSRDRPLWEMHVITGLDNIADLPKKTFAVVTKIHHAAVDGVAGIGVTMALHDLAAAGAVQQAPDKVVEPAPSPMQLIASAMLAETFRPMRLCQALPAIAQLAADAFSAPSIPMPPRTRFSQRISGKRTFDTVHMSLKGLKSCKKLVDGATVNDVVLAIVGGGMRRYLSYHGELSDRSLTAMVPISTRKDLPDSGEGNQVSQMFVALGTHIEDPAARLQLVYKSSVSAKDAAKKIDSESIAAISALPPAAWLALAARTISHTPNHIFANTVVTNIKGPTIPFYSCDAKLIKAFGMGPIVDGLGVFHTALSYCGELTLSVFACAELLPDVEFYAECLQAEYEALSAAAGQSATQVVVDAEPG